MLGAELGPAGAIAGAALGGSLASDLFGSNPNTAAAGQAVAGSIVGSSMAQRDTPYVGNPGNPTYPAITFPSM